VRRPSLHHLTVLEASPFELTSIAAAIESPAICIFANLPRPEFQFPALDLSSRHEMASCLAATGTTISNVEFFWIEPEMAFDRFRRPMELGAFLRAKRIVVHIHDELIQRAVDNFGRLCDIADDFKLSVGLEFMRFTPGCDSLEKAVGIVRAAGRKNAGVAIDALHLARTGGTPAQVANLDRALIGYGQLCDAPEQMPKERQLYEAMEERMIPGTGALPIAELVAALPPDTDLDLEVPLKAMRLQGRTALERAQLAMSGAMRILESASGQTHNLPK